MKKITLVIAACAMSVSSVMAQSNIISTVAGTGTAGYNADGIAATSAELYLPYGVCTDSKGNLYIAEWGNHRVRKVDATTGLISTIAGTGKAGYTGDGGQATAAEVWGPYDLRIDGNSNIYFADANGNCVRKISGTTGVITTVAGTGVAGVTGDGGPATSALLRYPTGIALDANGNIYITDGGNNKVRMINASTGVITTFVGTGTAGYTGDNGQATAAELSDPIRVIFDAKGNLYISDNSNNVVRKVDISTGIITTIAGKGGAGYSGDGGPATSATLSDPEGLIFDAAGNLYIADASNNVVREVTTGGIISTLAGNATQGYSGDGGPALIAQLYHPSAFAFDLNGNIFIDDDLNYVVRKVTAPLAVENLNGESNNVFLYPNPAESHISITMNKSIEIGTEISIYNVIGELVYSGRVEAQSSNVIVNTTTMGNGTYLLRITAQDGSISNKKFEVVR